MTTETNEATERLRAINGSAAFNRWAAFAVADAGPGRAELHLAWREEFGQYAGFLHAGMLGALIDTACGFAAATQVGPVLASHFAVNCLAPAVGESFIATASVVKAGRRQVFARAEVTAVTGTERKLVATGETILVPIEG
ncbi:PaaI family thioesterase [Chelatococcus reniformis]|uniref:Thioesterase domain-containing protein n=1 Tax=Chelatococcus reniformis TaxID=1494448 RepID=A0A916XKY1_9HYPH|nr:PaaI family thioesterase [Chelatococcus reniformis]GGC79751.1 hypothetical protein GCM10010994_42230 [Chelatococcus reniformis]